MPSSLRGPLLAPSTSSTDVEIPPTPTHVGLDTLEAETPPQPRGCCPALPSPSRPSVLPRTGGGKRPGMRHSRAYLVRPTTAPCLAHGLVASPLKEARPRERLLAVLAGPAAGVAAVHPSHQPVSTLDGVLPPRPATGSQPKVENGSTPLPTASPPWLHNPAASPPHPRSSTPGP